MKHTSGIWRWSLVLAAGLWILPWAAAVGAQKTIHLRNETILTEPTPPEAAQVKGLDRAVSGLYLVQLTGPVQEDWRAQLAAQQVVLLHYVPDDCYVARVKGASLGQLRGLSFVHWVGAFRPEHKVHRSAHIAAAGGGGVSVLVAPDAGPAELAGVRQSLQQLQRESHTRMGTVLHGQATAQQVQTLAASGLVLWIEPAPHMKMHDEISTKIVAGETDTPGTQALVHQMGYDGRGVTVSVADSGLYLGADAPMHPDLEGRVDAFYFYGLLDSAQDEHGHGSHTAGIVAANAATGEVDELGYLYGLGVAPGAHLVVQRIFDGDGGYQAPPSYGALTTDAMTAGAEIGSNSWGDDVQGRYDLSAMEFDALVRDGDESKPGDQPYILEFSAGNAGPGAQTMDSPGVAKNVIATGATESDRADFLIYGDGPDVMADFSSRGPCEDGRIKPDVVAPGTWISSLRSPVGNDDNAWATIDDYYAYEGGTSQAGPHVSGAAAVFVQWYREGHTNATPSPALVKGALINSAVDLGFAGGTALAPNMDEGWGRVDLTEIIATSRQYQFVDQSVLLKTGQFYEQHVLVSSADDPLKVTLVYTDVPAFPGAVPALVNDLDLEVVGPDGKIYRGNQFLDGESAPNAPSADNVNNVEGVVIWEPAVGDYLVRVRARSVAQDARVDTTALDQDFALVVSALMPQPGEGVVALDRRSYTVPGQIIIRLLDSDLIGQLTASVTLQSDSQPTPLTVQLHSLPAAPVFTGSVATAFAPAALDGRLHIMDGDEIRVTYFDASAGVNRTATAVADLRDPVISNVAITSEFGRVVVRWTTDEIASSGVLYNNGQPPTRVTTNSSLVTSHEMEITNLVYGQTYHFVVFSTDEAGNTATNDNGGAGYAFAPVAPPRVLLVDSCVDVDFIFAVPPLSDYTTALNQAGVVYEFWDATTGSKPTLSVLRNYRAVIWRLSEMGGMMGWTDWGTTELQTLTNYLAGGGSLLVASMDILSRLSEINAGWFVSNVFQVRAFAEDAGVPQITGVGSDPISSGFNATLDYSMYATDFSDLLGYDPDISDTITLTAAAAPIFTTTAGQAAGLRWPKVGQDQPGRLVFLPFSLSAVPMTGDPAFNRAALLARVLNWLSPAPGSSSVEFDSSAYALPSLVTVEVDAPDLQGQGQATVHFTNLTTGASLAAAALETVRPGQFRGSMVLVATNGGSGAQLPAHNGDVLQVSFVDPTSGSLVTNRAVVDTVPPVISNVAVEPSYLSAIITWETSKEADALVQFGESTFLSHSAYVSDLDVIQGVELGGLQPDRIYYFQVVSRDLAGNVAVDDNAGNLYTFRTLRPIYPPWSDDLEHGSGDWSVIDGDGTESTWQLGTPATAPAHSPSTAWSSDLSGAQLSQSETFLISPAIDLSGGNQATLRFWQNYDFSEMEWDIMHYGEVLLITNENVTPITLDTVMDFSGDWEEAEYDLTPYLGNVVYVAFHYVLFSMDYYPRIGWLVDDLSVTTSNLIPGTILITNNLFQAAFTLTGPINRSGQGTSLFVSNALPGEYVVSFQPVPYYQTPPSQTNTLAGAQLLVVPGHYTIVDTNRNGLPDAWESRFFGSVQPVHPGSLDTDGDGMSDSAEFMAGTNPNDPTSFQALSTPDRHGGSTLTLNWPTVLGHGYCVEMTTNLRTWTLVREWERATGSSNSMTVPEVTNVPSVFYRVRVAP